MAGAAVVDSVLLERGEDVAVVPGKRSFPGG
jgi:hypothetical protein